jgi:hypothetical protein
MCVQYTDFLLRIAIWLEFWTKYNMDHPNQRLVLYLGVYGALQVAALLILVISG